MIHVVDASAIGALLFGEADGDWVRLKLRRHPEEASALLDAWLDWNAQLPVAAMAIDFVDTMGLARKHNLTFYDASYLWLAQHRTTDLISLDAKLVRAARSIGLRGPAPADRSTRHTTPRSRN